MDTGLYHGLRFYEWNEDKPELTDNDFYCKDYEHTEYINMPVVSGTYGGLVPFGFKLPASALGNSFDANAIVGKIICKKTGEESTLSFDPADWHRTDTADAVYIHYLALQPFGATPSISPGLYHIDINNVVLDVTYRFYSDTFILRKYVASP